MLFTSLEWAVFLLVVFAAFHLVSARARPWLMLGASVVFYASWSVRYLLLIGGQLLVDWSCGYLLSRTEAPLRRKLILTTSIVVNLGVLCVFKYYGLFSRTVASFGVDLPVLDLLLPLAISFYTFESMSYTIDVYRRRLQPVRSPIHLALFITWFPHLIAGPIIRPAQLVPQIDRISPVTRDRFVSGLFLMTIGYCKKLLGADWLARVCDPIFADPRMYTSTELLIGVYAYAFQIYLDFSAYTDIARGASRWFGIELPENFNAPYLATSITDFWRRWHMTLSHWLRDYLYIPLGGSRHGHARTYVSLMLTMLLGGLWHGAAWTFVAWGGLHGVYLAAERALGLKTDRVLTGAGLWARRILTFHLVCISWVLFRAQSFSTAAVIFRGLARGIWHVAEERAPAVVGTVAIIGLYWLVRPIRRWALDDSVVQLAGARWALLACAIGGIFAVLMVAGATTNAFIYFTF